MLAIKGGTIYTITRGIINDGVILIDKGKILEVGNDVSIPEDAKVVDASQNYVLPGMIDAHTHLGIYSDGVGQEAQDHNEISEPFTPHLRVLDAIDPFDPAFEEVMQSGITTVMVAPGSANPIAGKCSVIKTRGKTVEEMLVLEDAGMKFSLGENPKRVYSSRQKAPYSRMGIAGIIRENLFKAYKYVLKKADFRLREEEFSDHDFKMESLAGVIKGKVPARFHAHKAHDIITAIRIAEEFDLDLVLEHCTEGNKVINEIAAKNIPVVLSPLMHARTKYETRERNFEIAGLMASRGVLVAVSTDGYSQTARWLPINAGLCIRYGMKESDALRSITLNPAKIMGVADRVGSLQAGKDADIVITRGHPLETRTRVAMVIVNGKIRYLRAENLPEKILE